MVEATMAEQRVQEWIGVVQRRGEGLTTADLHALFSPSMVEHWPSLGDADRFRSTAASSRFATCDVESMDPVDEHRVVVRLRRDGLELWCHVAVEPHPPHRISSVRDTLEDGVSLSAMNVAISRELHRRWSTSRVFDDWLAERIGGRFVAEAVQRTLNGSRTARPIMPLARFRLAEERLDEAVRRGCRQYLILGAGMDTWAHRQAEFAAERLVTVFEVDAPATQRFKRRRLVEAGMGEPDHVAFVGADFETDSLADRLDEAGFDPRAPTVVAWLGVVYYLTEPAIAVTLSYVGALAPGSELILDYFRPPATWDVGMRNGAILAATNDEPWQSTFTDEALDSLLKEHGLIVTSRLTAADALSRYPTDDDALTLNDATVAVVATVQSASSRA